MSKIDESSFVDLVSQVLSDKVKQFFEPGTTVDVLEVGAWDKKAFIYDKINIMWGFVDFKITYPSGKTENKIYRF